MFTQDVKKYQSCVLTAHITNSEFCTVFLSLHKMIRRTNNINQPAEEQSSAGMFFVLFFWGIDKLGFFISFHSIIHLFF